MGDLQLDSKGVVVTCPSCGQRNRQPYPRLTADTRCGKCGSLLFSVVRDGDYVHVAMGSLRDAPGIRPTEQEVPA